MSVSRKYSSGRKTRAPEAGGRSLLWAPPPVRGSLGREPRTQGVYKKCSAQCEYNSRVTRPLSGPIPGAAGNLAPLLAALWSGCWDGGWGTGKRALGSPVKPIFATSNGCVIYITYYTILYTPFGSLPGIPGYRLRPFCTYFGRIRECVCVQLTPNNHPYAMPCYT